MIDVSRTLMQAEMGYSAIEREFLSVIFEMERLHHFVFGNRVEVQTEQKPLIPVWKKLILVASPQFQYCVLL